jgi:hypothetical protein
VQIRFFDQSGGKSSNYLSLIRRSNFDTKKGLVSKDFRQVWQLPLTEVLQDEISKSNNEKSYVLPVSEAMRHEFAEEAAAFMAESLKPQIESACNDYCSAKLVSTDVTGLDNSKVTVSVYQDSKNPYTPTALIYWPQYTITYEIEVQVLDEEILGSTTQGGI